MRKSRNHVPQATLLALEADAISARSGFACLFSTADEYEAALIAQRRAQGRYHRRFDSRRNAWPMVAFVAGAMMMMAGAVLVAG